MEERLLEFIRTHLAPEAARIEGVDQSLFRSGLMDSFALVELAVFVEEEFGVKVPDADMTVANFDTVRSAVRTVDGHKRR